MDWNVSDVSWTERIRIRTGLEGRRRQAKVLKNRIRRTPRVAGIQKVKRMGRLFKQHKLFLSAVGGRFRAYRDTRFVVLKLETRSHACQNTRRLLLASRPPRSALLCFVLREILNLCYGKSARVVFAAPIQECAEC